MALFSTSGINKTQTQDQAMKEEGVKTSPFKAKSLQLMSLIINTFCLNKDIFLRKHISNSSDALGKISDESLTDPSYHSGKDLHVNLIPSKQDQTFTIMDTGTGMAEANLINNLALLPARHQSCHGSSAGWSRCPGGLAGLGLPFTLPVLLLRTWLGDDGLCIWESSAGASSTVKADTVDQQVMEQRLPYMQKKTKPEYLEERRIEEVVKKHSQFIGCPVILFVEKKREKEVSDNEAEEKEIKRKRKKKEEIENIWFQ